MARASEETAVPTGSRSLWTGAVSFGLVTIPVELHAAISEKDVHFHMLHDADAGRVHQKLVCEKDGAEVTRDHVVKGYEVSKGKYVEMEADELKKLMPEATQRIDISDFVNLSEIDPIYYMHTYSVQPGKGGAKAYSLLREAMEESHRVGIATVVIRGKQSLCALRPGERSLLLSTMHYADEIIAGKVAKEAKSGEKEMAMAKQLIDSLAAKFVPGHYKDDYREKLLGLIRKKSKGKLRAEPEVPPEKRGEIIDLAEALRQSLASRNASANTSKNTSTNTSRHASANTSRDANAKSAAPRRKPAHKKSG